jgi:hypothetical protein
VVAEPLPQKVLNPLRSAGIAIKLCRKEFTRIGGLQKYSILEELKNRLGDDRSGTEKGGNIDGDG